MKLTISPFCVAILLCSIWAGSCSGKEPNFQPNITLPDGMFLSTPQLIKSWGYPAETHEVVTKDGYYLTLHRIPHGKPSSVNATSDEAKTNRPVIFLLPGLLLDSAIYVMNFPHQSPGYILADAGYDVWIGNNRGTTHSKKHQSIPVNSSKFWDFSYQEMAQYDLPAMVDYILKNTQQEQLYYVGYSISTTFGFIGFADNPELQKKIKKYFALAPITVTGGGKPSMAIQLMGKIMISLMQQLPYDEVLPHGEYIRFAAEIVCPTIPVVCRNFIARQSGGRKDNINATRVPLYLMHMPAGTSMKNMIHIMQKGFSNKLQAFDYGSLVNLIKYGSLSPPVYDLKKVTVPTVLFTGTDDHAASRYIDWTVSQLPKLEKVVVVKDYGHDHFFLGMDAKVKVYDKLIEMAK